MPPPASTRWCCCGRSNRRNRAETLGYYVWDFGGQQIYHATHQFFLTKSSLYVLVESGNCTLCQLGRTIRTTGAKAGSPRARSTSDRSGFGDLAVNSVQT